MNPPNAFGTPTSGCFDGGMPGDTDTGAVDALRIPVAGEDTVVSRGVTAFNVSCLSWSCSRWMRADLMPLLYHCCQAPGCKYEVRILLTH